MSAADRLREHMLEIARCATARLYADDPTLLERYGERGRLRCAEDLVFTVDHLTSAVEMENPQLFADYVRWLDELLRARNVGTEEVRKSLRAVDRELEPRLSVDEVAEVRVAIAAGMNALDAAGA